MPLPPDSHVHSEWSWDTRVGDMEGSCARAVEIGLPAIAFTEHLDHTAWRVATEGPYVSDHLTSLADPSGILTPPAFDAAGYLAAVQRCRERFPQLRILSGLELGEPHRHADQIARVLSAGRFDRLLGSLHTLADQDGFAEPWAIYPHRDPHEVVRAYLADVATMVTTSDTFDVLAHIDYPVRSWPTEDVGPFDPSVFEDEFREALRVTALSGRALEVNTRLPLHSTVLGWWHEEGGDAITFGSDAHLPAFVGHGFGEAAQLAQAHGFRPGRNPHDRWGRG
ncbi:PHP domain-containing protein [Verrucosispora sioxanthis]|uniref:Histidinol-phosphatase n=1 Tax=Verrucosispora sioxanthis TaxID=2499994 RepID=A0A6M1LA92_9ACTN|nr:PHP domain-containing protein [Verrucosispora sioxanthis]NEE66066.1 PHP domain-containing protein [Verrucosispora sioxanthis]NGM15176.1 PHP domain-containing protein [Verrucosispora sioxanthis]